MTSENVIQLARIADALERIANVAEREQGIGVAGEKSKPSG